MKKTILYIFIVLVVVGAFFAWKIFGPTVDAPEGKFLYIPTGAGYAEVKSRLLDKKIIGGSWFFDQLAKKAKYPASVKAGRYEIKDGMSLYELVRMLRRGSQSPVSLVITKLRTREDLAQKIARNFEADSLSIIDFLNNADSLKKFGLDTNTVMTAVIPNTYSIHWNTSASKIFRKLYAYHQSFWNAERKQKAASLNMSPQQVYTMASIVEEETAKEADKGKIASVYINRIARGQRLEADPTIKFALRNFGLKRIYHKHKEAAAASPYNTYFAAGLPPGPICTPSPKTIDAVLNAPATDYIFFVAKPDWSGLSNFTSSYEEHLTNARVYQRFLDSVQIK